MSNVWRPTEREIEALLRSLDQVRYEYAIKRVAGAEQLWSLRNEDGWVLYGTGDGRETHPIWPHQIYAKACAEDEWSDCEPVEIELAEWLEKWTPGMIRDKRMIAVFPIPKNGKTIVVEPERFASDLQSELAKYE